MQTVQLVVSLEEFQNEELLRSRVFREAGVSDADIASFNIIRKSIDARQRSIKFNLKVEVFPKSEPATQHPDLIERQFRNVSNKAPIVIVGAGPAGLFAALRTIELGRKPIILERGKDVRARRRDLALLNRDHIVNPESNYCFGEGGAGTYSDGKLYTRSTKRGKVAGILSTFVQFGADQDILVEAHPHIGTNRLPSIIQAMREMICECGGEVRFNSKLTDIILKNDSVVGAIINADEKLECKELILATGHSARDIYKLLDSKQIEIEAKQFAMGVRVEHPQALIDELQYHGKKCDVLPPAAYSWVEQVKGRGVYSFCMCPGGIIAPCATSPGEVVTNGWSPSKRNNPFANSGIVVSVESEDLEPFSKHGPLAGMYFQESLELAACAAGGGTQVAPAQRLPDFISGKLSSSLPKCSYHPGLSSHDLNQILSPSITVRLQQGFTMAGKKMNGYLTEEAVVVAVESRTSSPVRIPRNQDGCHPQIKGLYPTGEGAGYAGGIVSAALDGERIVDLITKTA